jgi:hypothetical protein
LYVTSSASAGIDVRLTDRISLGVLASVVGRDLIEDVLIETGRLEKRSRLLPAHVMVRFCQAMTLFQEDGYEEVMCKLVESLRDARSWSRTWEMPSTAAITKARQRLGWEPMRELFDRCAVPVAELGTKGAWLAGRRLMAVDGSTLDVPRTPENDEEFGRHSEAAFSQARIVALAECGSHAIIAAALGGYHSGEHSLATEIAGWVESGMLLLADRGFFGFGLWCLFQDTGADLLWRGKANLRLPVVKVLSDGSYLSLIADSSLSAARRQSMMEVVGRGEEPDRRAARIVRVVEYDVPDREGGGTGELICLITSILDPADATAKDLAAAYHERWEIENTFDELKTHQRGPARVLRSKSPAMVKQEIWAMLLTHYCIRKLICEAADEAGVDPDRISFMRSLRIIRRQVTGPADFSP